MSQPESGGQRLEASLETANLKTTWELTTERLIQVCSSGREAVTDNERVSIYAG